MNGRNECNLQVMHLKGRTSRWTIFKHAAGITLELDCLCLGYYTWRKLAFVWFKPVIFGFFLQQPDYDLAYTVEMDFLKIYPAYTFCLLDLRLHVFHQVWKPLSHSSVRNVSSSFASPLLWSYTGSCRFSIRVSASVSFSPCAAFWMISSGPPFT